jgi:RHS repeat-associated protein
VARQTSSATTEYVFDQQGNVVDRTNGSGVVQSVTQYDGWGNEQAISGTPSDPFGYNGQAGYYLDRETGLYLCQHRFYDPANGRWVNRDPIGYGGGTNLYGYCTGEPVGRNDPHGYAGDLPASTAEMAALADDTAYNETLNATSGMAAKAGLTIGGAGLAALAADPNAPEQAAGLISNFWDAISPYICGATDSDSGVYAYPPGTSSNDGTGYVGQSGDMPSRDSDHTRSGKLSASPDDPRIIRIPVNSGKNGREIVEELLLMLMRELGVPVSNQRNPIGKGRWELMPPGYPYVPLPWK